MPEDEITRLRTCYDILRKRIAQDDEGLAYWQMNLKIATYFLKRYDPYFSPTSRQCDSALSQDVEETVLRTHHLLQYPDRGRRSYPRLTEALELELKRRVAKYFESRT